MDETGRGKRSTHKMENLSLETKTFPRDFLQGFLMANPTATQSSIATASMEDDDSELNLGLSLGGRFGVDSSSKSKLLVRSSSIASSFPVVRDDDVLTPPPVSYQSLMRTSSLPLETEEEWRKRKELQTLRRMAAKRRRSEKQKNLKNDCGGEADQSAAQALRLRSLVGPPRVPPSSGGQVSSMDQSQCGSSSGMSEQESRAAVQGSSGEASPSLMQEQGGVGAAARSPACRGMGMGKGKGKGGINDDSLEEMPCVFTEGDGPNGRRVEGILYKYGRGEEVRIMCVCHGHFLSPSEFVKHAGGSDVAHPLKHIVVTSSSLP